MKKLVTMIAIAALGGAAITGFASPGEQGYRGNKMENRMERMTEHLNLTDQQQEQVRALIEGQMKERQARREQMKENIRAVLTDEQKATFDEMHAKREKRRMARYSGEKCEHGKGYRRHGRDDD